MTRDEGKRLLEGLELQRNAAEPIRSRIYAEERLTDAIREFQRDGLGDDRKGFNVEIVCSGMPLHVQSFADPTLNALFLTFLCRWRATLAARWDNPRE